MDWRRGSESKGTAALDSLACHGLRFAPERTSGYAFRRRSCGGITVARKILPTRILTTFVFLLVAAIAAAQVPPLAPVQAPAPLPAPSDVAASPADAQKTSSGLSSRVLTPGTGQAHPAKNDLVTVHYNGWTTEGKMFDSTVHYSGWTARGKLFDSSIVRGQPETFALDGVIPGWTEGLQLMVEGEKTRFWIPEYLAYKGQSEPYGMLVFDVELIKIR